MRRRRRLFQRYGGGSGSSSGSSSGSDPGSHTDSGSGDDGTGDGSDGHPGIDAGVEPDAPGRCDAGGLFLNAPATAELPRPSPRTAPGAWLSNTRQRYGAIAIALHWTMALLLIVLILMGIYMVRLPDAGFDMKKITLILYHKELGVLALVIAVARLAWRLGNALPSLAGAPPDWQKVVARFVHLCFYGLMFALPVTGWLMSSAVDIPVSFLGLFDLPDFIAHSDSLFRLFILIHQCLGYALAALLVVHVGAALWHHLVCRDETLEKMLPGSGD